MIITIGAFIALVISVLFSIFLIYFALSIRVFSAEFVYMKLRFGKPVYWRKSSNGVKEGGGLGILWRWVEDVYAVPTIVDQIDLEPQTITTKSKKIDEKTFNAVDPVKVNMVMFFTWPTTFDGLRVAYKFAPPTGYNCWTGEIILEERNKLKNFVDKYATAIIRKVLGGQSWYEIRQGISNDTFVDVILPNGQQRESYNLGAIITQEIKRVMDNPIARAGWEGLLVEIEEVQLPPGISEAMSKPQIAAYEADARRQAANALAYEKERVMEVVKKLGDEGALVYTWDKLAEAAQGPSNTVIMQIPDSITKFIEQKTGVRLSNAEMKALAEKISSMTGKGGKS